MPEHTQQLQLLGCSQGLQALARPVEVEIAAHTAMSHVFIHHPQTLPLVTGKALQHLPQWHVCGFKAAVAPTVGGLQISLLHAIDPRAIERHPLAGRDQALLAALLLVALISWNPADASLNAASSLPTTNWLGANGALFADLFMQSLGLAAWPAALLLVAFGLARAVGDAIQQRLKQASDARAQQVAGGKILYSGDADMTDEQIAFGISKMKELEKELSQYKKIVAEQTLKITILKDVIEKKL